VKSSSLLFVSPSLKYSSNADFGDTGFRAFLPILGGSDGVDAAAGGGGGDANVDGINRSLEC